MRPASKLDPAPVEVLPERLRFGFYQLRVLLPVKGSWITMTLEPPPLAWGRAHMRWRARRLVRRFTSAEWRGAPGG